MEVDGFQLLGVCFEGEKLGQVPTGDLVKAYKDGDKFVWIHIEADDLEATYRFLATEFRFHPLEIEDALSPNERPALRVDDDDLFLVAPAVVLGQPVERYVEIAFFADAKSLVTVATEPVPLVDHRLQRCAARPASNHGSVALLHSLIDEVVDGYFPAVDTLGDLIDELENDVYRGHRVDIGDALALKRRLLEMRRQLAPLRDILNGLLRRDVGFIDAEDRMYFQDVYDHALRIVEDVDMERDILSSVLDAQVSVTSNNLNEVMRTLTVISTVLMTGAFVAGIYGMNFDRMPELHWAWGYPFSIFLMVVFGALEVWFFRRKGWI